MKRRKSTAMVTASELLATIAQHSPHLSWIKDRTIFLSLHGSRAYNTHIKGSDCDYKGICVPPKEYLLGFCRNFEQAELKEPDTTIFDLRKFFALAAECNPNCLEILFTNPAHHTLVTTAGEQLLAHRSKFLSRRIKYTMSGYAKSQLHRMKQHRHWLLHPQKEPPTRESLGLPPKPLIEKNTYEAVSAVIQKELDRNQFNFLEDCSNATKIAMRLAWQEMLTELKITTADQWLSAARIIGLNDNFIEKLQLEGKFLNAQKNYQSYLSWKKNRNSARFALEEKHGVDCKFIYHLVRLLRECAEVLATGKEIEVFRHDREELLAIRNGAWSFEQTIEYADKMDLELDQLMETSPLPKTPDYHALDRLCVSINESFL